MWLFLYPAYENFDWLFLGWNVSLWTVNMVMIVLDSLFKAIEDQQIV